MPWNYFKMYLNYCFNCFTIYFFYKMGAYIQTFHTFFNSNIHYSCWDVIIIPWAHLDGSLLINKMVTKLSLFSFFDDYWTEAAGALAKRARPLPALHRGFGVTKYFAQGKQHSNVCCLRTGFPSLLHGWGFPRQQEAVTATSLQNYLKIIEITPKIRDKLHIFILTFIIIQNLPTLKSHLL